MDYCINQFCEKYMYKEEDIRKNNRKSLLNLKLKCEEVKIKLNTIEEENIIINNFYNDYDLYIKITRKDLDKIYSDIYIKFNYLIEKNLKKINKNFNKIDEIFLLGRGTKLNGIKDRLINLFGKDKLRDEFDLNKIIPLCTIIKAIKSEISNINFYLDYLIDESLGIAGKAIDSNGKLMIPLIKKHKTVPINVIKNFNVNLTKENQNICVEIYEGNQKYIKDNKKIGEVNLNGINYIGNVDFTLEFRVDINAKLKVNLKTTSNLKKEEIFDLKLISINKKDKKIYSYKIESIYNINLIKNLIKFLGQNFLIKKNEEKKIEENYLCKMLTSNNYDSNNAKNLIKNNNNNINNINLKNIDNNIDKEININLFNNLNNQNIQITKNNQNDSQLNRFVENQSTNIITMEKNQSDLEKYKEKIGRNFKNNINESQKNNINQNKNDIIDQNNNANNNNNYEFNNQGSSPPPISMEYYKMINLNNNPPISRKNINNHMYMDMNSNEDKNPKINEKNKDQNFSLFIPDNNPKIDKCNNDYNLIQSKQLKNYINIENKNKFNNSNQLNNSNKQLQNNNIEISKSKSSDKTFGDPEQIYYTGNRHYNMIDNNTKKDEGIVQLIKEFKENKIKIRKELLKNINSFIACIGPPGAGKSTFCSNYYKTLYKVKNNYFESSEQDLTFTKGIWMITDCERRKIPIMIKKDLIDVEGFQVDDAKCWKYVMIIAFLSTDLIILNRNARNDDLKKIIRIIEKSLKIMGDKNIPRILKNIFIHTSKKKNNKPIKDIKKDYIIDTKIFKGISFDYIYLPNITEDQLEENNNDLMGCPNYKKNFEQIFRESKFISKFDFQSYRLY